MVSQRERLSRLEKEQLIIDTAVKLFRRKGAEKTKVAEITAEAGIGKSTFYEYFTSKGDLICRWVEGQMENLRKDLIAISSLETSAEKISALFLASCDPSFAREEAMVMFLEFWRLALNEKNPKAFSMIHGIYEEYRDVFLQCLREGMEKGEFRWCDGRMAAAAILAGIDGLWLQYLIFGKRFDIAQHAEAFIQTMLAGLSRGAEK